MGGVSRGAGVLRSGSAGPRCFRLSPDTCACGVVPTVVLAMFLAPITFEMLRPQLTGLYTSSLKPTVTKVVAKAHGIAATLSGMDRNRRLTVAAGVVVALLIVWQLFGSFIGLRCIASCALTSTLRAPRAVLHGAALTFRLCLFLVGLRSGLLCPCRGLVWVLLLWCRLLPWHEHRQEAAVDVAYVRPWFRSRGQVKI